MKEYRIFRIDAANEDFVSINYRAAALTAWSRDNWRVVAAMFVPNSTKVEYTLERDKK